MECWGDALWGGLCDPAALGLENVAAVYSSGSAFVARTATSAVTESARAHRYYSS